MSRGVSKIYPIEFALAQGTAPTTLYTECLQANPSVALPEPEYADHFNPEVVAAFERFANGFHRVFGLNRQFPNARLMPAFMPSESGRPGLTFMAAWGSKTEWPLPRDYFSPMVRAAVSVRDTVAAGLEISGQRKELHKTTLNAVGFLGHLRKSGETIEARMSYSRFGTRHYQTSIGRATLLAYEAYDAVEALEATSLSPLHFHAGVKYVPGSHYIGNEFANDSQHRLIKQLMSA